MAGSLSLPPPPLSPATGPIADAAGLEAEIRAIPGVVGTGLFLGVAETVLVGTGEDLQLAEERVRTRPTATPVGCAP